MSYDRRFPLLDSSAALDVTCPIRLSLSFVDHQLTAITAIRERRDLVVLVVVTDQGQGMGSVLRACCNRYEAEKRRGGQKIDQFALLTVLLSVLPFPKHRIDPRLRR